MSKNYQKAAIRRIFALAVLIAGTCYIAATAWATTCFLPSGNCSTGRVGNEDKPNPNPDPTPGPTPDDACKGFKNNTTQSEYDWKSKTSCFKCTTCTSNGKTNYYCIMDSGYYWDRSDGGHCCVSGEKWYSKMGMCCSSTSGCTCPTLKKWSNGECVCQYAKTSTGTCCEKGKIADKHLCCNAGEHAENTICCPVNKHEEGGSCVCDANYETDGTGCKPIDKCKGYDLTASQAAQYNTNCYACSQCGSNTAKYKCEVRTTPLNGYKLDNGTCKKEAKTYTITVNDEVSYEQSNDLDVGKNIVRIQRKVKCDNPKAVVTLKTKLTYAAGMMTDGEMTDTFGPFGNAEISQARNYSFTCDGQSIDNACITYLNFTVDLDHNIAQTAIENNTPCAPMTIKTSNGDTYNVVCVTKMNTCTSYGLSQEADCKSDETLVSDKTHPTDDFGNKCGTCVKTTPSTVKFTFHNICGKKDKIVNRVAWLKNGKLQYETLGNGIPTEVPYSDEYVVLSSTDNGYVYMINAGNIRAGNECGVTTSEQGYDYHKCYVTTGIQYNVGMFSGSIHSDNWLFNSLPADSHTMPYFSGYGLYLHLYSATPGKFYQVYTYCASTCGSYNQDCYYGVGGSVKDRYECNTCQKSSGSSSGSSGGNGNPFH